MANLEHIQNSVASMDWGTGDSVAGSSTNNYDWGQDDEIFGQGDEVVEPVDGSDTTGITGGILSVLAGIIVAIGTSFSGPGAIAATLAAAGVASAVGNLLEEVLLDWWNGRDPRISKEEFIGMLDEIGIDVVLGPVGAAPIFKFGGKTISGVIARPLTWIWGKITGRAAATSFKEAVEAGVKHTIQGQVDSQIFIGAAKFLNKIGASDVWLKAVTQVTGSKAVIVKQGYRAAWAKAYRDLSKAVGKSGIHIIRKGQKADDAYVKKYLNEIAFEIQAGKVNEGELFELLNYGLSGEARTLLEAAATKHLTSWMKRVQSTLKLADPFTIAGNTAISTGIHSIDE